MHNNRQYFFMTIFLLVILFVSGSWFVYTYTRESYLVVGFSNGQISARDEVINRLEKETNVKKCNDYPDKKLTEIFNVKDRALHLIKNPNETIEFCTY